MRKPWLSPIFMTFLAAALLGAAACSDSSVRAMRPADAAAASDSAPELENDGGAGGFIAGSGGSMGTGGSAATGT
ncbi:MAG TPA: endoglucanase, partial [Polyangia bacterium]